MARGRGGLILGNQEERIKKMLIHFNEIFLLYNALQNTFLYINVSI